MWMNVTKVKIDPARVDEFMALIRNDKVTSAACATGRTGGSFVLQSTEDPGEIVSITVWQDAESGMAFFSDAAYAELGQQMRPYLTAPPERASYEVKAMRQAYAGEALTYP